MADCVLHARSAFPLGGTPPSMAVAAIGVRANPDSDRGHGPLLQGRRKL